MIIEERLHSYIDISRQEIAVQLSSIAERQTPAPGRRQVPFNEVETLLCYGLFSLLDPHRYGGGNIDQVPLAVKTLASFFRRSPGSITNKMLNMDGSRHHGKQEEPLLFAYLATNPSRYLTLYQSIITIARNLSIEDHILPDFLNVHTNAEALDLLGQDDLPISTGKLLEGVEHELKEIDAIFALGDQLTEKLAERKVRLAQHRFAVEVLDNCGKTCVFCGFSPSSLPGHNGLLRASHIKPWAVSNHRERVDVRNGLAACPMHDAAFDQGYLTVNGGYHIHRANILQTSIRQNQGAQVYFSLMLSPTLVLPEQAKRPAIPYLHYHRQHIFKG